MTQATPNKKHDHVYAIVRLDIGAVSDSMPDMNLIYIPKIVLTEQNATDEVDRLNKLNAGKGCTYYWQITRIEKTGLSQLGPEEPEVK